MDCGLMRCRSRVGGRAENGAIELVQRRPVRLLLLRLHEAHLKEPSITKVWACEQARSRLASFGLCCCACGIRSPLHVVRVLLEREALEREDIAAAQERSVGMEAVSLSQLRQSVRTD